MVRLSPAERTLLAALVARLGVRVTVDVLEEALWPAGRPPSARKTLQGTILRLRRVLGPSTIVHCSGGYRLDPERVDVDARRVSTLVTRAGVEIAQGHPSDAIGLLREASMSFHGDPYEDVPDSALPAGEVQRLRELQAMVFEESVEAELACGAGQQCIGDLEVLLDANPFRERAWGQLMLALYRDGRPADALAAFSRARNLLAFELGLEPGPVLRNLEHSILTHDPRLGCDRAGGGLGPSNLPTPLSPLVGREDEIATLEQLCEENRLVTLTGTGGIGKTRLAIAVAARTVGSHEFGPYFADLASISDTELVPAALATAFGVRVDAHDDVIGRIRSALDGHDVVVVMDNCEHLLAGVAELVAGLLGATPSVRVVATSREPFGVAGERVFPVGPLELPPSNPTCEEIENSGSGALFLARLPVDVATSVLTRDDLVAVGTICRRIDGIPLGLELAAARSRTLSLPELAHLLDHSIGALASTGHATLPRHRTMRAALDWGYQFLSPHAKSALHALSTFAGGCELPAFAAVCLDDDGPQAVDVLDELVRTSFVTVDFTSNPARYRLLEPVRQYASELLDADEHAEDRRQRHLHFYLDVARAQTDDVHQPDHRVPVERLWRELGNFRVALDWAAGAKDRTEAGLWLAFHLQFLWLSGTHQAEGVARLAALLRSAAGTPEARSAGARVASIIEMHRGDGDGRLRFGEQAVEEAAACADRVFEGRARQVLSRIYLERGEIAAARRQLAAAEQIHAEQPDPGLHAFCLSTQIGIDWMTGALDNAADAAQVMLGGDYGSASFIGPAVRVLLSVIELDRGDLTQARSWAADALELGVALGEQQAIILANVVLVVIECAAGRIDRANAHFVAASELNCGSAGGWDPLFLLVRADLALAAGNLTEAMELAEVAVARAGHMCLVREYCASLRRLGDAQLAAGNPERSLATFRKLIAKADAVPYPCRVAEGHEGAAAASNALGDRVSARCHLAAGTEIRHRIASRRIGRPAVEVHLADLAAPDQPSGGTQIARKTDSPSPWRRMLKR